MKNTYKTLLKILSVGVLLYLFLVSIGLMGAAFKGFGKGFAENLIKTTSNPFIGLFIGILSTSISRWYGWLRSYYSTLRNTDSYGC
jgi:sodium-dependent phosphate cotransporter